MKGRKLRHQPEITQMAGFEVQFTRKAVRNINLRIGRMNGEVLVSAPHHIRRGLVEKFVASRAEWITKAKNRALARQPAEPAELVSGETIAFLGKQLVLTVEQGRGNAHLDSDKNTLCIFVPADSTQKQRLSSVEAFYRRELYARLPQLLALWQPVVGVQAKECRVRRMKTRWGSCNIRQARVWMSLELVKYPPECIEYVLVHELTHLLESSHNKRFHRLVGEAMPNWKERKAFLNKGLQSQ